MRVVALVALSLLTACGSGSTLGTPCTKNSDCASGLCGGTIDCGGPVCECASDFDCPTGQKCEMSIDCGNQCH